MPDMPDDFVTIAQAAVELGVSERTAHRYAVKLSDSDRQKADNAPLMVRLSAMREKLTYRAKSDSDSQPSDNGRHMADSDNGNVKPDVRDELIAQLRQENAHLWQSHERMQVLLQDAQRIAQRFEDRATRLEEQNAKLIAALPVSDTNDRVTDSDGHRQTAEPVKEPIDPYGNTVSNVADSVRQNTGSVPTESPLEGTPEPGRVETPPSSPEGKSEQPASQSRRWWQVWKR